MLCMYVCNVCMYVYVCNVMYGMYGVVWYGMYVYMYVCMVM